MEKLEKLSDTLSEITGELLKGAGVISYPDFDLLNTAKEKVIMAGAALVVRHNSLMTDEERNLVQKLVGVCADYIHFIGQKECKGD